MTPAPGADHATLPDAEAAKLYFDRFARIITHLRDVARVPTGREIGDLQVLQISLVENYLNRLANVFHALSMKHLMAGRGPGTPDMMAIDRIESGFPIFLEIAELAHDRTRAAAELMRLPTTAALKDSMIAHMLSTLSAPTALQVAMSQRIYFEELVGRELYLPQNRPQLIALSSQDSSVSAFLLHWAVYDGPTSLPMLYFMVVEDTARLRLDQDQARWADVQNRLLAQSVSALKLLTIARGFDEDFDDLHPKFLRRVYVGPMYSHGFTEQSGPLREVLAEVSGLPASDWALAWTTETLASARQETVSTGFFSRTQREVFDVNALDPAAVDAGVTRLERALILPLKPYQVLTDRDPPGMRDVRKHVVAEDGRLMTNL